jgi:hypothetical protein
MTRRPARELRRYSARTCSASYYRRRCPSSQEGGREHRDVVDAQRRAASWVARKARKASLWGVILLASSPSLALASRTLAGTSHGRVAAIFLLVVAALFGLLWLSQILSSTVSGALPVDLKRTGLPANPVYALDLAVFLPLAVIAAIGVLRNLSPAADFALPMLVWVILTSAGIGGGFFFEARAGETAPIPVAVLIGLLGVLAIVLQD